MVTSAISSSAQEGISAGGIWRVKQTRGDLQAQPDEAEPLQGWRGGNCNEQDEEFQANSAHPK